MVRAKSWVGSRYSWPLKGLLYTSNRGVIMACILCVAACLYSPLPLFSPLLIYFTSWLSSSVHTTTICRPQDDSTSHLLLNRSCWIFHHTATFRTRLHIFSASLEAREDICWGSAEGNGSVGWAREETKAAKREWGERWKRKYRKVLQVEVVKEASASSSFLCLPSCPACMDAWLCLLWSHSPIHRLTVLFFPPL